MENIDKKTIGRILELLKKHTRFEEDDEINITKALNLRNEFIHDFYMRRIEMLATVNGRNTFFDELKEMRTDILLANNRLNEFIDPLMEISMIKEMAKHIESEEKKQ